MATAKSDDDNDDQPHPLAKERPGVYVQVVSPRRRKGRASIADEADPGDVRVTAVAAVVSPARAQLRAAIDAQPTRGSVLPADTSALDSERASGERPVDRASIVSAVPAPVKPRFASENSAPTGDLVFVSLPPPPRVPSFDGLALSRYRDDQDQDGPSILDAPTSLRPEPPAKTKPSWPLFAFIAAMSAIIGSAGIVALREAPTSSGDSVGSTGALAPAELASPGETRSEKAQPKDAPNPAPAVASGEVPPAREPSQASPASAAAAPLRAAPAGGNTAPTPAVRTLAAVARPALVAAPGGVLRANAPGEAASVAPAVSTRGAAPNPVAPADGPAAQNDVAPAEPSAPAVSNAAPAQPSGAPAEAPVPSEPSVDERPIAPAAAETPADLPHNPYEE